MFVGTADLPGSDDVDFMDLLQEPKRRSCVSSAPATAYEVVGPTLALYEDCWANELAVAFVLTS